MSRPRTALPVVATLLIVVACGGEEAARDAVDEAPDAEAAPEAQAAPDRAAAAARTGAPRDSQCDEPPYPRPTGRQVRIAVLDGDSIAPDPDPVVQPRSTGQISWRMEDQPSDYGWKVTFKAGQSPLPDTVYWDSAGRAGGDRIDRNAPCGYYPYTITVWPQDDPSAAIQLDPGADIIP